MKKIKGQVALILMIVAAVMMMASCGNVKNYLKKNEHAITAAKNAKDAKQETEEVANSSLVEKTLESRIEFIKGTLNDAKGIKEYKGKLIKSEDGEAEVEGCYSSTNDAGKAVAVSSKSFGGELGLVVCFDNKGEIIAVQVESHSDTPGLGTKTFASEYLAQYVGVKNLQSSSAVSDPNVTHVTGATISSNAVHRGVYLAIQQYKLME